MRPLRKLAILFLALAGALLAQAGFYLKDGDRVVFYGDSITDQRLYTTFTETYVVTRFPQLKVTFVNSGWGGDRVTGGAGGDIDLRLQRDVFPYRPTVVTIMLGMNDGRYRAFDPEIFNTYASGYAYILKRLKTALPQLRITVIQPSPYDDVTRPPLFEGGYNSVLLRYGQYLKDLAQGDDNLLIADLNTPVVAALEKANKLDAKLAAGIIRDRVHPGPGGHLLMAAALLKAWNAPALVSAVEIDAAAKTITRAENTKVSDLAGDSGLSWTQTDAALPMPLDKKDATLGLVLKASDFIDTLDQETLKVTGLSAERYSLKIDAAETGVFTKEQLAEGINLAPLATPMAQQAADVHALTLLHNNIHFARWRTVQVPLRDEPPLHFKSALDELDKLEGDLVERQRATAQPKPRHYELSPQ